MDADLIRRWNGMVSPGDEIWRLGDFARTTGLATGLLAQLNGRSHGRLKPLLRQIDVGVDVRGYAPVALEALSHTPGPPRAPT